MSTNHVLLTKGVYWTSKSAISFDRDIFVQYPRKGGVFQTLVRACQYVRFGRDWRDRKLRWLCSSEDSVIRTCELLSGVDPQSFSFQCPCVRCLWRPKYRDLSPMWNTTCVITTTKRSPLRRPLCFLYTTTAPIIGLRQKSADVWSLGKYKKRSRWDRKEPFFVFILVFISTWLGPESHLTMEQSEAPHRIGTVVSSVPNHYVNPI